MDKQENDEHAYKETTLNDEDHEVFPKGPLGPILGAPKQYEPPRQDGPRFRDGNRLNPHVKFLITTT
jgi:hypothetical protein